MTAEQLYENILKIESQAERMMGEKIKLNRQSGELLCQLFSLAKPTGEITLNGVVYKNFRALFTTPKQASPRPKNEPFAPIYWLTALRRMRNWRLHRASRCSTRATKTSDPSSRV